jgi:hypothetical protein
MLGPDKDQCAVERPILVWLGPPLAGMQTDIAETFDVRLSSSLNDALAVIHSQAPAAVVCFLDVCNEPADFVHLLMTRGLSETRLVYIWPSGTEGWAQFRTRTGALVLPGSFHESELVQAVRSVVESRFSLFQRTT